MPTGREVAFGPPGNAALNSLATSAWQERGSGATGADATGLVGQAASILAQQTIGLPMAAGMPFSTPLPAAPSALPGAASLDPLGGLPPAPGTGPDLERLRRQAHEIIETVLSAWSPRASVDTRVPLLSCVAPVDAGGEGCASIRVSNEDPEPSEVALYCSNFVSDSGYDIPSLRVATSPRVATIPPKGETTFELKIAVPAQAPPGSYSGLVQASGTRYVKAVLTVEVR